MNFPLPIFLRPNRDIRIITAGVLRPDLALVRASNKTAKLPNAASLITVGTNTPAQDYRGLGVHRASSNLYFDGLVPIARSFTVTVQLYTLSFIGTGSVVLSGAASATLNGTGATDEVKVSFTPSAGTLIATPSGSVSQVQVEAGGWAGPYIDSPTSVQARAFDLLAPTAPYLGLSFRMTLLMSFRLPQVNVANDQNAFHVGVSSGPAAFRMRQGAAGTTLSLGRLNAAGTTANSPSLGTVAANAYVQIAASLDFRTGDAIACARINGVTGAVQSVAGGPLTSDPVPLYVGSGGGTNSTLNGFFNNFIARQGYASPTELLGLVVGV